MRKLFSSSSKEEIFVSYQGHGLLTGMVYGVKKLSRFCTQVFFYTEHMSIRQNQQLGGADLSQNRIGTGGWMVSQERDVYQTLRCRW